MTALLAANKLTYTSPASPLVNTTAFELVTLLQRQQIKPVPTPTSNLAPLQSSAKPHTTNRQVPSSLLWSPNSKNEEPKGWSDNMKTSSSNIYNID